MTDDSSRRGHDRSLPSEHDFDPFQGNLDAQWAYKNFGGLTLEEAHKKFRECPLNYQEDFMFMGTKAFAFYFPVIEGYFLETAACVEYDDRQAWILAVALLSQFKCDPISHLKHLSPRVLKLATFVRENVGLFSADQAEQRRIDAAWQELHDWLVQWPQ